jgi:serine/threonine protein kinase/tetratricopeptide (TPR) repeat protein
MSIVRERQLGPYRLSKSLGQGGMGVVYCAEHCSTGTRVAVKTLRANRWNAIAARRLRQESRVLQGLHHPGVVRFADHGEEEGVPWYAMQYLKGAPFHLASVQDPQRSADGTTVSIDPSANTVVLRGRSASGGNSSDLWEPNATDGEAETVERSAPGPGPTTAAGELSSLQCQRIRWLAQVCNALDYLHGQGVIHCDLKPSNILITAEGKPVVVDFGLALIFGQRIEKEALEMAGEFAGTVYYLAPEQAVGWNVDARTDLYAIGAMLYEVLTGNVPYPGRDRRDLLALHRRPPPPSPTERGCIVPEILSDLTMALISTRPKDRPGHAAVVYDALQRCGFAKRRQRPASTFLFRPTLQGRGEALKNIEYLQRAVVDDKTGHSYFLVGPSGLGKSHLARDVLEAARRQGWSVAVGHGRRDTFRPHESSSQDGQRPFVTLSLVLGKIMDTVRGWNTQELDDLFVDRLALLSPFFPGLQTLIPHPTMSPARTSNLVDAHQRTFRSLEAVMLRVFGSRPLLLVVDDLQWADELSLGFLEYLARSPRGRPWLVLGFLRKEEQGQWLDEIRTLEAVTVGNLGPISKRASSQMLRQMLGSQDVDPNFLKHVMIRAEGNPFVLGEYLRHAIDVGLLRRGAAGAWSAQADPDRTMDRLSEGTPERVDFLVSARIHALPEMARRLAETAAVLGRTCARALLATTVDMGIDTFEVTLDELYRRDILRKEKDDEVGFPHDKVREVLYAELAAKSRESLHLQAARSLEASPANERDLAVLAWHWHEGGRKVEARGHYFDAARFLGERYALREAETCFKRGLQVGAANDQEGLTAKTEFAERVLLTLARFPEAEELLKEILHASKESGFVRIEARAIICCAEVYLRTGRLDLAVETASRGQALFAKLDTTEGLAPAYGVLGAALSLQGHYDKAAAKFKSAIRLARESGDERSEGVWLRDLGNVTARRGNRDQAETFYASSLEVARKTRDRLGEGVLLGNLGVLCRIRQAHAEAMVHLESSLRIAQEFGTDRGIGVTHGNIGSVYRDRGLYDKAMEHYVRAVTSAREHGHKVALGCWLVQVGHIHRSRGEQDDARHVLTEAERLLRECGARQFLAECLIEDGHLRLLLGQSARRALEEVEKLASKLTADTEGDLGRGMVRLRRAIRAKEEGLPLVRGQCPEDWPQPPSGPS